MKQGNFLIKLGVLTSFFVVFEPSPCDIFFACAIILGYKNIVAGLWGGAKPIVLSVLFICVIGVFLTAVSGDPLRAISYQSITIYLFLMAFLVAGAVRFGGREVVDSFMKLIWLACCVSSLIGCLTYVGAIPLNEYTSRFDRPKGFFKDPNVYGPFCSLGFMLALAFLKKQYYSNWLRFYAWASLPLLLGGMLVSFSRGSYLVLALSLILFLLSLIILPERLKFYSLMKIFAGLLVASVLALSVLVAYGDGFLDFINQRLAKQEYDNDRFYHQNEGIEMALRFPLGIGPGQSEEALDYATHNTYIRYFLELGFLGGAANVVMTLAMVFFFTKHLLFEVDDYKKHVNRFFVSYFISVCVCGYFVDTLHWRHFYLTIGMIMGVVSLPNTVIVRSKMVRGLN